MQILTFLIKITTKQITHFILVSGISGNNLAKREIRRFSLKSQQIICLQKPVIDTKDG